MKNIKLIVLGFSLCFFVSLNAQNYVDLAKFYYSTTPDTQFDSIDGTTQVEELGADLMFPIQLDSNNVILAGLFLEKISAEFSPPLGMQSVSTINLKIGYNRKHSEKWSGTYMILPKIASDFKNISSDDFQLGGLILMKYKKKENLKYNLGIYYNNELFGPFVVPLFGLYYISPNKKFEANITLPIWADVNYKINDWLNLGSNFSAFVRSYNLNENGGYIVKKTNELFGYLQFNLTKNMLIQTKTGYSIGRSYKVYDDNDKVDVGISAFRFGDKRKVLNPTFNDGLIFKVRFIYRFHL